MRSGGQMPWGKIFLLFRLEAFSGALFAEKFGDDALVNASLEQT
jgi:hypothetical protein